MRKRLLLRALICLMLAVLSLIYIGSVSAQTNDENIINSNNVYNILMFKKEQLLNLPINHVSYWFNSRPGTQFKNIFIELCYSHSSVMLYDRSFITIMFNGVPVSSKQLSNGDSSSAVWHVNLPIDKIKEGFNEISVLTAQRTVDGPCRDIDNDANWVVLHDKSFLHLETSNPEYVNLEHYPYPFLNYLANQPVNCTWYLPPEPTTEEIKAMLQVAADWGNREQTMGLPIRVKFGEPKPGEENQVLIGEMSRWPEIEKNDLPADTGILFLDMPRKGYNGHRLLISGTDVKGLSKATVVLSRPEIVSQAKENHFFIKDMPQEALAKNPLGRPGDYTLSEMGFDDFVLAGAFHQSTSIVIKRPVGYKMGSSSYIEVHFRHAPALNGKKSSLTVYVNGLPMTGVGLNAANEEKGIIKVKIPPEELDKQEWIFEFAFYHDLGEVDCSKRYDEVAWSVVEKNSLVYLAPGSIEDTPSLLNFPSIGNADRRLKQDCIMWLSYEPSEEELSLAAVIAARAAQNNRVDINWNVIKGDLPKNIKSISNPLVMIGYHNEAGRLSALKGFLPVLPNEKNGYDVLEKLDLAVDSIKNAALIEASVSPWNKQSVLYAVIGMDDAALERVGYLLTDANKAEQMEGQVCVVYDNWKIKYLALNIAGKNEKQGSWLESIYSFFVVRNSFVMYVVIIGFVVAVLAVTLWITQKRS